MSAEVLRTYTGDGREITLPTTIRDIRAALPAHRREQFSKAVEDASLHNIHSVVRSWVMELLEEQDPQLRQDLDELEQQEQDRRRRGAA